MTASVTVSNAAATNFVVSGVATGTYYVSVAAFNRAGETSDPSNYVATTIQ